MSQKRSRANFEADLQAQQSPFVVFGTPLPPLDPEVHDDGSYVPVWKQEVRDERGRRRLHGAFTGGWSAGYFNTVGSKEGWTPSTFVSSRTNRHKDGGKSAQRPEDFMDEEDLADKAESEKLQTANDYAGLGSTISDHVRAGGLADLFRPTGETMGVKLLKRMGWKDGQGIGPKIRRSARLDIPGKVGDTTHGTGDTYLFAPENVRMVLFVKKLDRKGLGYQGQSKLTPIASSAKREEDNSSGDDAISGPLIRPPTINKKKGKPSRGGIGIGILNDTGSDDEDPYEIGPKISYNRVIGGDKKKKKGLSATSANPNLRSAPVFISKKENLSKAAKNLRRCHDGKLPLDGFVFGNENDSLASQNNSEKTYPPPEIPSSWKSSKQRKENSSSTAYMSTTDAAKALKLDPKTRAELLGEAQLPGKSVFDFLNPAARDRLAAATGKTNLPPALGEIPKGFALTPEEKQRELLSRVPVLEKDTAVAVLARGTTGATPYADNDAKRARYRSYLEYSAGFPNATLPGKLSSQNNDEWLQELYEFHSCAKIFKPMTGMMASRFTTSSSRFIGGKPDNNTELLAKPVSKPSDPAEEAAKLGMYGAMTRLVTDFYPTRLLCKRFNVRPPAHVQPDPENEIVMKGAGDTRGVPLYEPSSYKANTMNNPSSGVPMTLDELLKQAQSASTPTEVPPSRQESSELKGSQTASQPAKSEVDPSVNEALEGKRAEDKVLQAIFGDSSDEEE
ncbi:hypothetical protein BX600DRAFT_461645 [Xylariales sp. PMI_506]|nr:hypothetical protein BX600DRAFT_461645 [Xylariales sp. PMI_506]